MHEPPIHPDMPGCLSTPVGRGGRTGSGRPSAAFSMDLSILSSLRKASRVLKTMGGGWVYTFLSLSLPSLTFFLFSIFMFRVLRSRLRNAGVTRPILLQLVRVSIRSFCLLPATMMDKLCRGNWDSPPSYSLESASFSNSQRSRALLVNQFGQNHPRIRDTLSGYVSSKDERGY
ncbi:uncharacterized protein BO97DRAFT_225300 [Aspergillus homomorphus CBS 101889]|uniref:Uncharacterized protein n=1 Tax=Aspergillus homomorphus (strain CBS 101889) TaxID=1450537 RepID=A0A395HK17_ASPHC|nr:hypothetical protein BO97DRAFT_225300 [Aspergillus homomorphus CBS 101889]RAL08157.1 hypothetical protein BO97DRAFT_225300 [Aspergillus homomorphus CBS 101889]